MPRELLVVSPRAVDVIDVIAAGVTADAGIRTLWGGGAWQLVDDAGGSLLTVLRSRSVEAFSDLPRWGLVESEYGGSRFVTEVYLGDGAVANRLAAAVAAAVDGAFAEGVGIT